VVAVEVRPAFVLMLARKISFGDAIQPHQGVLTATSFYTNLIPVSARVILIKAVDVFGVPSQNPAIIYRDAAVSQVATNQVEEFNFHEDGGNNLLVASRDLSDGAWTKTNVDITTNVDPGPSAEGLADEMTDESGVSNVYHSISQTVSTETENMVYVSVNVKPVDKQRIALHLDGPTTADSIHVEFDLEAGTPLVVTENGDAEQAAVTLTNVGGGWYNLSVKGIVNTSATGSVVLSLLGVANTFTNDPDADFYSRTGGDMYPDGSASQMYKSATGGISLNYN